ncbi:MFS transporter [Pelomonas sp. APW6]|uniref:MFS transporter n=1 Tax=Roseateles subflavus TaxID=3053353 RepID=A0ABT7LF46_9BURK|nr:MFS transporter [Pelomonas sp. APW6]MDL5030835.1 MFS transporter [Pelomonas sp. APW6]
MPTPPAPVAPSVAPGLAARLQSVYRLAIVTLLGFASGLPLSLTGPTMQAWLSGEGLDLATIGVLSLVGLPYTFKFLWAPLMDRFELPVLGRRRGWMVLTQLALAGLMMAMAACSPRANTGLFALLALGVAFASAAQDIVIDAYRTDVLLPAERGLGASLNVAGYRLAMIVSGGLTFIWVDPQQGGGWTWPEVYRAMAWLMVAAAVAAVLLVPRLRQAQAPQSVARHDVLGFLAVLATVGLGAAAVNGLLAPALRGTLAPLWAQTSLPAPLAAKWTDFLTLLLGIALIGPAALWAARRARFETLLNSLGNYFAQPGALAFLGFIVLYKLGDAFAQALLTPFFLQGMHFSTAEIGVAYKVIGMWLSILGALLGGALMLKLRLWRSLLVFGCLQTLSALGLWWLAQAGPGQLGRIVMPAFDWGFVKLAQATPVDVSLMLAVANENLCGGMATAALLALLMSLCNQRFTATQFALLSAFAMVGRVWVGPLAGVLAESIGWPSFFVVAFVLGLPALAMLLGPLRRAIQALEVAPDDATSGG